MSAIFALANQKGGVAKTTTTGILAAGLHKQGFSVLTIDCDPQGNLSMSMAADNQSGATMYEVMKGTVTAREAIQHTAACDIIPANTILAGIEQELHSVGKEMTLREKLRDEESGVADDYDYILIDCPPSLGLLTVNALTAADYLLIPTMAETFAASGITQLYDTFRSVKKYTNPALKIDAQLALELVRLERRILGVLDLHSRGIDQTDLCAELAHDLHLERHVDDLRHVFDADRAIREQSRRYDGHCCILRARNRYFTVQRLAAVDYIFGQSQPTPHCTVPHPTWAFF